MAEEKPDLAWALGGSILNVEEIAVTRKAKEEGRENVTPVPRRAGSCRGASNTKKSVPVLTGFSRLVESGPPPEQWGGVSEGRKVRDGV